MSRPTNDDLTVYCRGPRNTAHYLGRDKLLYDDSNDDEVATLTGWILYRQRPYQNLQFRFSERVPKLYSFGS